MGLWYLQIDWMAGTPTRLTYSLIYSRTLGKLRNLSEPLQVTMGSDTVLERITQKDTRIDKVGLSGWHKGRAPKCGLLIFPRVFLEHVVSSGKQEHGLRPCRYLSPVV